LEIKTAAAKEILDRIYRINMLCELCVLCGEKSSPERLNVRKNEQKWYKIAAVKNIRFYYHSCSI
jgi:hypothetical protein